MVDAFESDVFLSHNSRDKPAVRRLAERLVASGLRVWFDEWSIKPGDDIYLAIERGLECSRVQVLCLSPAALGSNWVGLERSTVLFRDPANSDRRFIPLLLADCKLPDTLRRYKYVDYRDEAEDAFAELLNACRSAPTAVGGRKDIKKSKSASRGRAAPRKTKTTPVSRQFTHPDLDWVYSVLSFRDDRVASGSQNGVVRIWDWDTGEIQSVLRGHTGCVNSIIYVEERNLLISAAGEIIFWNPDKASEVRRLTDHRDRVEGIAVLPGGSRIVSGGWDLTIKVWDLQTGECLTTILAGTTTEDDIFSVEAGRTEQEAITGHRDGTIRLWDLATGICTATMTGHASIVYSIRLLSGGHAISSCKDHTLRIWDLATASCTATLEGHTANVLQVAPSPDGSMIASAGFIDHSVRLFDWRTGALHAVINMPRNSPLGVSFTPDGAHIVVSTVENALLVYQISEFLHPSTAAASRRYVNAKVVLVGHAGVGKTALAHRLVADQYVHTDSTHGLNVWRLDLPLPVEESTEREALLWDLAGQEDYRLIHQLYLHDTALALLLINPQADDPFAEAADWAKALRAAAHAAGALTEPPKLLIPARNDVGGMIVSQGKIDAFLAEHGFVGSLPTSAKSGFNCSDGANGGAPSALKHIISESIQWDKLPWTATPRLLAALKNAVISLTSTEDIRLIRFAELAQRLEQALPAEKFGDAEVRTALTLLANHGIVLPLKFGDLVLLRPEVLSRYAAAIIRAARAHKDEIGCVAEEAIFAEDFDLTGVDRLPRADEELLMRAIVQTFLDHALCIREQERGQTLLIFPSQYRRDREIPTHPSIFIAYTFSGELQTIYTTLIVRLWHGAPFDHKELWRNAAEFTTSRGDTAGLLFDRLGDGRGRLSLFFDPAVPDELKIVFIEFVHRHLQRYAQDLARERRYVCVCGKAVTDMAAVESRIAAGQTFVRCQHCDKRVPFKDHIEQRLGSLTVQKQVTEIDRKATTVLDNQAREQILVGHMMAICGEANQIFRELNHPDYGIDGEIEFRTDSGEASGRKIYVQLKSGPSHLRRRARDGRDIFDVPHARHLDYWVQQPVDVFLVVRDGEGVIRWMNISDHLRARTNTSSRQIPFDGEKLDFEAVWRLRDQYISKVQPGGRN